MTARKLTAGVYAVGAIDWDRRLFDELIPLPDGTTYNAYLIKGSERTALIDTVDPTKENELIENLKHLKIDHLDYIILNHGEQDHSGTLPKILELYPKAKAVTNLKCKKILMDLLLIPEERFVEISDTKTVSLGDKSLEFLIAPWVHWPETMLTYVREDKLLFPCDLFGSHLATSDLYAEDEARVYPCSKRYYAEIMMPFRTSIKKHMEKLEKYEIKMIAPSHGPIYNKPDFILNAYREWISDQVKNEVIIPYVSMHGSVEKMVAHFVDHLMKRNITIKPFNMTKTDIGELAMAIVDAATIVIASPTVLVGPHPAIVYGTYLTNALRPKTRFASIIGSYGWGGKMVETLTGMLGNLKVEIMPPVIAQGHPREEDFRSLEKLADEILAKHRGINIIS